MRSAVAGSRDARDRRRRRDAAGSPASRASRCRTARTSAQNVAYSLQHGALLRARTRRTPDRRARAALDQSASSALIFSLKMASRSISRSRFSARPLARRSPRSRRARRAPGTSSMLRNSGLRTAGSTESTGWPAAAGAASAAESGLISAMPAPASFPHAPQPAQVREIADAPAAARPRGIELDGPSPASAAPPAGNSRKARRSAALAGRPCARSGGSRCGRSGGQPAIDVPRRAVFELQLGGAERRPLARADDDRPARRPALRHRHGPPDGRDRRRRRAAPPAERVDVVRLDAGARSRQPILRSSDVDQAGTVKPPRRRRLAARSVLPAPAPPTRSVLSTSVQRLPHFSSGSVNVSGS